MCFPASNTGVTTFAHPESAMHPIAIMTATKSFILFVI
jgi:hypothetical protein